MRRGERSGGEAPAACGALNGGFWFACLHAAGRLLLFLAPPPNSVYLASRPPLAGGHRVRPVRPLWRVWAAVPGGPHWPPIRCGPLVSVQCASLFIFPRFSFPSLPPHCAAPLRLSLTSGEPQPLAVVRAAARCVPCTGAAMQHVVLCGAWGCRAQSGWLGSRRLGNHGLARLGCRGDGARVQDPAAAARPHGGVAPRSCTRLFRPCSRLNRPFIIRTPLTALLRASAAAP